MSFFIKMSEEDLETTEVFYMRRTGAYGALNVALMNSFKEWVKAHELYKDDAVILGIALDDPGRTNARDCRYDVCMPLPASGALDRMEVSDKTDGVKVRRLEGGTYLVFLIEHTPEAVQRAWTECFSGLVSQGFRPDPTRPIIERYAKKLVDQRLCELCVPILR